ncbi:hypothetical protein [Treponema sp.]|uniref:hypothetical protein n=1 Tax=Treponema sp. TaxID=166 RepID=UPI00388EBA4F
MDLKVVSVSFICSILLASCVSHENGGNSDASTLKSTASMIDSSTKWTDSIEARILSEDLSNVKGISNRLSPSPELFPVSEAFQKDERVYPGISGAFSLDTSRFPESGFSFVDGFLSAFEKGEGVENFFEPSTIYTLVMFKYDFQRLFGDMKLSWHAIGEPFSGDGYYQCPVRLFFAEESNEKKNYDRAHADAIIFIRNSDSGYKIISIDLVSQAGE